jgi:hypothetical protein
VATIPGQPAWMRLAYLGFTPNPQPFHQPPPQPSYTINRGAHQLVKNTARSSLLSFHFLELGLVVWELESSRACLGILESSSEVWYSSCIFPIDIYQYNLSSLLFESTLLPIFIYLSKLSNLCAEILSSSLGFVFYLVYRDLTLQIFSSGLGGSSQFPRLRGISLERVKRNPSSKYGRGI